MHHSGLLLDGDRRGGYPQTKSLFCSQELKEFFHAEGYTAGSFLSSTPCEGHGGNLLCPVHALAYYVKRMALISHTELLLVGFRDGVAEKAHN